MLAEIVSDNKEAIALILVAIIGASATWADARRGRRLERTNTRQHADNSGKLEDIHADVRELRAEHADTRERVVRLDERSTTNTARIDQLENWRHHQTGDNK